MRFILDSQLPRALARAMRDEGYEAVRALDLGLAQSLDRVLAERAHAEKAIVVTKDEDFVELSRQGVRVLWVRLGNCSNQELIGALLPALPNIRARFERGEFLVEVR